MTPACVFGLRKWQDGATGNRDGGRGIALQGQLRNSSGGISPSD